MNRKEALTLIQFHTLAEYEAAGGRYDDSGNGGERVDKNEFLVAATVAANDSGLPDNDVIEAAGVDRRDIWYDTTIGWFLLEVEPRLVQALRALTARRDRTEHPRGKFDRAGRWYPDETEERDCCRMVRSPSRAHPYSYMTHCRSLTHVAALYGVDATELRTLAKVKAGPAQREGGDHYFKAVAIADDGRMLSIFDGSTEYRFGQTLTERPRQNHGGGYYVYPNAQSAARAEVPAESALRNAKRLVIRVRAEGNYCRYDNGKLAFARVTPLERADARPMAEAK